MLTTTQLRRFCGGFSQLVRLMNQLSDLVIEVVPEAIKDKGLRLEAVGAG